MGLRKRKPGAVGGVLQGRARQRSIEIRRKTGIQRKWQSRLVLWPESPTARVRLTPLRLVLWPESPTARVRLTPLHFAPLPLCPFALCRSMPESGHVFFQDIPVVGGAVDGLARAGVEVDDPGARADGVWLRASLIQARVLQREMSACAGANQ